MKTEQTKVPSSFDILIQIWLERSSAIRSDRARQRQPGGDYGRCLEAQARRIEKCIEELRDLIRETGL